MLHPVSYYYDKSRESGISNLNCKIHAYIRNSVTGETKYWPEVKNYYQYIDKCYAIAQEVPFEELELKYYDVRFSSKERLQDVLQQVRDAQAVLNKKDLNYMMGYTPITHMREQLRELENRISDALKNYTPAPIATSPEVAPAKKSFLARLFR